MKAKVPNQRGGARPGAGRPPRPLKPGERRRAVFFYATVPEVDEIVTHLDVDERKQTLLAKARLVRIKRGSRKKEKE